MPRLMTTLLPALLAAGILLSAPAKADDTLKLAVGAPNNWDSGVPDIGKRAGIFKKHGLDLEILYTNGGGETMQAVISGSVDIGIGAGTGGVLGAFAKGAPVRILLAGATGASDLYWYVPAASPLKSFGELNGKTVAYSTNGASTHITLLALIKHFNVTAKPIATGAAAVTLTQAMSGQVDVGWASPPFGLAELDDGKIRLIARGSDAPSTRDQTVRVHIVNANALAQRRAVMERFAAAYRETYEWLYGNPEGVEDLCRLRQGVGEARHPHPRRIPAEGGAAAGPDIRCRFGDGGRRRLQVPGCAAVERAACRGRSRFRRGRNNHATACARVCTSMLTSSSGVCVVSSMPQLFTHS